jgi:hypothetical protein
MEDVQVAAAAYYFISAYISIICLIIAKESENLGKTENGG